MPGAAGCVDVGDVTVCVAVVTAWPSPFTSHTREGIPPVDVHFFGSMKWLKHLKINYYHVKTT